MRNVLVEEISVEYDLSHKYGLWCGPPCTLEMGRHDKGPMCWLADNSQAPTWRQGGSLEPCIRSGYHTYEVIRPGAEIYIFLKRRITPVLVQIHFRIERAQLITIRTLPYRSISHEEEFQERTELARKSGSARDLCTAIKDGLEIGVPLSVDTHTNGHKWLHQQPWQDGKAMLVSTWDVIRCKINRSVWAGATSSSTDSKTVWARFH